ncbi:hypothetical protein [Natranaerofaba carboxydovora]|uniref:hypothetical protein n=1 Tax=Natranaerofaba carboxydovora TaxID=2742683 RepID=UPI001F145423|nr:hypothetical protein [Natranaerofaba carboxydovora]UMZ75022.1 hypothetical protein ACONDI_02630 [Natranaerofaba carboxydovora]
MLPSKILVLVLLIFAFVIVGGVALVRIMAGLAGGLSLLTITILLPLIIGIIYGYNERSLDNFKSWFFNTPKKKVILRFSVVFWYIGLMFILSYSLYDNISGNITFVASGGFLLGYGSYIALSKVL